MARFSICTAFFNDDIERASTLYEYVKMQDVDWEWVVTDDFSEDPSVMNYLIGLSRSDRRVRYVEQSHKMQFMRNPSIFAEGEFVFHIDSDDLVYPGYLSLCQSLFDRIPEVGIILAGGEFVSQHGQFRGYSVHMERGALCFLGRCWRRSLEIDFDGIIEDKFFTLCNDMFIVKYLNTLTKMIVVPRMFIKYRVFEDDGGKYKPFGERTALPQEKMDSHYRSHGQFLQFYEKNMKKNEGIFPFYEGLGYLAKALYPVFKYDVRKINMIGFYLNPWQMALIEDLYSDMDVSYGPDYDPDAINVVDTSSVRYVDRNCRILAYFHEGRFENFEYYKDNIDSYLSMSQNNSVWICKL